jgi:hypothetical protein
MATTSKKIGSFQAQIWRGSITPAIQEVRLIDRTGVDGTGALYGAFRAPPATIRTRNRITSVIRIATRDDVRRMVGSSVNVYDEHGLMWPSVTVIQAVVGPFVAIAGSTDVMLDVEWTLLPQSVAP